MLAESAGAAEQGSEAVATEAEVNYDDALDDIPLSQRCAGSARSMDCSALVLRTLSSLPRALADLVLARFHSSLFC